MEYLVYAYLQEGADDRAATQLKRLRATARLEPTFKTAFHLSSTAGPLRLGATRLERGCGCWFPGSLRASTGIVSPGRKPSCDSRAAWARRIWGESTEPEQRSSG